VSDHERWADAAGAYVLGAMSAAERRDFEAHLAGCRRCRDEVEDLRPAAEALPMASPPMQPPPALKDRVIAEVEREAELLRAAGPGADRVAGARAARAGARRRRSLLGGWRLAPAAAALLAAGVLAGIAVSGLAGDGARTYAVSVDRRQAPEAEAQLRVVEGEAMLVAEGLPAPPEGRVYQVWVKRPGSPAPEPTSALFLPRRDGSAVAAVPGVLSEMEAVLVTHEPAGGSRAPTQRPLLTAPMS
jgi:anti-sigma-K factor RskA